MKRAKMPVNNRSDLQNTLQDMLIEKFGENYVDELLREGGEIAIAARFRREIKSAGAKLAPPYVHALAERFYSDRSAFEAEISSLAARELGEVCHILGIPTRKSASRIDHIHALITHLEMKLHWKSISRSSGN